MRRRRERLGVEQVMNVQIGNWPTVEQIFEKELKFCNEFWNLESLNRWDLDEFKQLLEAHF
jgi:hypothetical protein